MFLIQRLDKWNGVLIETTAETWFKSSRAHAGLSKFTSGSPPSSSHLGIVRCLFCARSTRHVTISSGQVLCFVSLFPLDGNLSSVWCYPRFELNCAVVHLVCWLVLAQFHFLVFNFLFILDRLELVLKVFALEFTVIYRISIAWCPKRWVPTQGFY